MMRIRDVMRKKVVTIDCGETVERACTMMGKNRIGSIIVTVKGKPYGIFTERDLLSKVITKGLDIKKVSVGKFASSPMVTVRPDFSVREVARIMAEMKIKRLPVMDKGKLVGIFTASDLADVIAKSPLDF